MTLDLNILTAAAAIIAAAVALYTYFAKVVRWMDKQQKQDKEIKDIKEEMAILTSGVLACLKGIQKLGANDDDTNSAIRSIEDHLNTKAHK